MIAIVDESTFYDLHGFEPTPEIEWETERVEDLTDEILNTFDDYAVKNPDNSITLKIGKNILGYIDINEDNIELTIRNNDLFKYLSKTQRRWVRDMKENGILKLFRGRVPYYTTIAEGKTSVQRMAIMLEGLATAEPIANQSTGFAGFYDRQYREVVGDLIDEISDVFDNLVTYTFKGNIYLGKGKNELGKFEILIGRPYVKLFYSDKQKLFDNLSNEQKEWIEEMKKQKLLYLIEDKNWY